MEIKNVILVKSKNQLEFLTKVDETVRKEQEQRRKVEVQYAPVVINEIIHYTAFITSGVIGE